MFNLLKRLWVQIHPRRRMQFGLLLILMLLVSFAEVLGVGAVLPFLAALTAPEKIFEMPVAQPFIRALGINKPNQLVLPLTIAFIAASIIAGFMRLLLLWANTRLAFSLGADLGLTIYRNTLYQPYIVHSRRNSSEVIDGISGKANAIVFEVLLPFLLLVSSSFMFVTILSALLIFNPIVALAASGSFCLIYIFIVFLMRYKLFINGQIIARESSQVIKSIQEGLGGIRDVLIDASQPFHCAVYSKSDRLLRRAQGDNSFMRLSPRYLMEALGMVVIASLAYLLSHDKNGIYLAIPVLGVFALGMQRLLPLVQQMYSSWASMRGAQAMLQDALQLLEQPLPKYADSTVMQSLPFNSNIRLNNVDFQYSKNGALVLKQINLTIPKGSRIGFIGKTGSGKSTLLDVVMGLIEPTKGTLEVDGRAITLSNHRCWQAQIAHVPQTIFLTDGTVEENIAFGEPKEKIDHSRVKAAAQNAQLADTIEAWPNKYQTVVGERGIQISGGQRQRIGIARALYKQAKVIIFDEATSALDSQTERAVMLSIESLSAELTILVIAHRLTTLANCTQIIELSDGNVKRVIDQKDFNEIIR